MDDVDIPHDEDKCLPPCEGVYLDFERSEASLRDDMTVKNQYFLEKYRNYTRFFYDTEIGNFLVIFVVVL